MAYTRAQFDIAFPVHIVLSHFTPITNDYSSIMGISALLFLFYDGLAILDGFNAIFFRSKTQFDDVVRAL